MKVTVNKRLIYPGINSYQKRYYHIPTVNTFRFMLVYNRNLDQDHINRVLRIKLYE